jgi:hypothetical protein
VMRAFIERAKGLGARVGRRGAALLLLALFEGVIGFELLAAPVPTVAHNELYLPVEAWGVIWLVASGVGVVATFWRKLDAMAFGVVIAMLTLFGFVYLVARAFEGLPRGWVSSVFWFGFATHAPVVSGWPEPGKVHGGEVMNGASTIVTPPIVVALLAIVPALLAYRQSKRAVARAADLETSKVDSQAYARAVSLYETGIAQLVSTVTRLESDAVRYRDSELRLRDRISKLEGQINELRPRGAPREPA